MDCRSQLCNLVTMGHSGRMTRTSRVLSSQWESVSLAWQALRTWRSNQLAVAVVGAAAVAVVIGLATVLIPNPVFGRDIAPVAWNYPVWIVAAALSGILLATYVRPRGGPEVEPAQAAGRRGSRLGSAGGILAWFAVGCPVCNKIALLALGYSGAITWFTPVQPFLGAAALVLLSIAVIGRLRGQVSCPAPARAEALS